MDSPYHSLQPINDRRGQVGKTNVRVFRALKVAIGVLLLVVVLFFTVLSKLTLISMTSRLNAALARDEPSDSDIVSLYWQLLFVIMVPQCITFLRTMMRGVCGKRTATFPWPTFRALLVVSAPSWSSCIVYVYGARWGGGGGGSYLTTNYFIVITSCKLIPAPRVLLVELHIFEPVKRVKRINCDDIHVIKNRDHGKKNWGGYCTLAACMN